MESTSKEARVNLALVALERNPALSIRAAAKIYNVPKTTILRRRKHQLARHDTVPNSRKLTNLEESIIVEYILDLDSRSFPPRLSGVQDMANRLLADRDAPLVGVNWASRFVKRQTELTTRFTRRYDYKRALCKDPKLIRS
ncbi:helix-turn-helix, psq domain-containing protein [Cordyceps javanica]|nr:helix-turn-helix, psq domain-containing protein [Cordyceps javanica]